MRFSPRKKASSVAGFLSGGFRCVWSLVSPALRVRSRGCSLVSRLALGRLGVSLLVVFASLFSLRSRLVVPLASAWRLVPSSRFWFPPPSPPACLPPSSSFASLSRLLSSASVLPWSVVASLLSCPSRSLVSPPLSRRALSSASRLPTDPLSHRVASPFLVRDVEVAGFSLGVHASSTSTPRIFLYVNHSLIPPPSPPVAPPYLRYFPFHLTSVQIPSIIPYGMRTYVRRGRAKARLLPNFLLSAS
jgi:hypothetical protein